MPLASFYLAEREGFEPPEALTSTVFKTAAFDHSAISPGTKVDTFFLFAKKIDYFFTIYLYLFHNRLIINILHIKKNLVKDTKYFIFCQFTAFGLIVH